MQPIRVDGGLTILRRLASYAFGKWAVEWPDTVPEDQRPDPGEGFEWGFVADFGRNPGRMGRRFARADASITAAEYTASGEMVPYSGVSDVEQVLDGAMERTGGSPFVEYELTREHLDGLVPYVDFGLGDVLPLSFWGKIIHLPVVQISAVSEAGAVVDWRVQVGGSLLADANARERANAEMLRLVAKERRERRDGVQEAKAQASSASQAASRADTKAETADAKAVDAQEAAELAQTQAIEANEQAIKLNQDLLWLQEFRRPRSFELEFSHGQNDEVKSLPSIGGFSFGEVRKEHFTLPMLSNGQIGAKQTFLFTYTPGDWLGTASMQCQIQTAGPRSSGYVLNSAYVTGAGRIIADVPYFPDGGSFNTRYSVVVTVFPAWPSDSRYKRYFQDKGVVDPVTGRSAMLE